MEEYQKLLLIEAAEQLTYIHMLEEKLKILSFSLRDSISEKNFEQLKLSVENIQPLTTHLDFSDIVHELKPYDVIYKLEKVAKLYSDDDNEQQSLESELKDNIKA